MNRQVFGTHVNNRAMVDLAGLFLLAITPVICLYLSHGYPIVSTAFGFFALCAFVIAAISATAAHWRVPRYLAYWVAIAYLVRFLTGMSLTSSLLIAVIPLLVFRKHTGGAAVFTMLAVIASGFIDIDANYPKMIKAPDQNIAMQANTRRPPVFHLIFDEAAGPRTLINVGPRGRQVAAQMSAVLATHNFVEFTNAHSSTAYTRASLADMMELAETDKLFAEHLITNNRLFTRIAEQGYTISVMQSGHLAFCSDAPSLIYRCYEYPINSLSYLKDNQLDDLSAIVPATLHLLWLLRRANQIIPATTFTAQFGLGVQQEIPEHLVSLHQRQLQERLLANARSDAGSGSHYYLTHFVYPHFPYYQQSDCTIKPPFDSWRNPMKDRYRSDPDAEWQLSAENRVKFYEDYMDQYACLSQQLDHLVSSILQIAPDATILVHSDHSARISTQWEGDLNSENHHDLYPVLLAIRTATTTSETVDCTISLVEFAQYYFEGAMQATGDRARSINTELRGGGTHCQEVQGLLPIPF